MKMKRYITVAVCVFSLCLGLSSTVTASATAANNRAGKAFAKAISDKTIAYGKYSTFSIGDMDGDGVKDLLVSGNMKAKIYAYKSGQIKTILKYVPEYTLGYDTGKKVFWESGEGDGAWHIAYKLKNGKLKEVYRYYTGWSENDEVLYYYQKAGEDPQEITEEKYRADVERVSKCTESLSKAKLINRLKNLS